MVAGAEVGARLEGESALIKGLGRFGLGFGLVLVLVLVLGLLTSLGAKPKPLASLPLIVSFQVPFAVFLDLDSVEVVGFRGAAEGGDRACSFPALGSFGRL